MKRFIILAAALAAALNCMAAKPVKLSLNLEKGGTYGINTEALTTIKQNVFGQSLDIDMVITGELLFKVETADTDGYGMSVWYQRLAMKMSGVTEMEADSDKPIEDDPLSVAMKAMTGKPFTIMMSRSGKIVSIEGSEEMMNAMVAEMGELFPEIDEATTETLKKQLAGSYSGDALKGNIESGMVAFPDKPVSVGDSWTDHLRFQAQFAMDSERTFTVTDINKKGITIKCEAAITTDPDSAPVEMNGMQAKYEMTGTMTAETVIDPASCWTVSGNTIQDMSGNVKILPSAQMPNGFSIPLTMKTDTTVTGITVE